MGLSMAMKLLDASHMLVCLSRNTSQVLQARADELAAPLTQWSVDLTNGAAASARLSEWLATCTADQFASATLINNAGVIPEIVPLRDADPQDLANALRVGLEAPMQLTSAFLGASRHWAGPRKVLNISSGLGRRPMASQAAYCAAKAGMDHFTRCLSLDEALAPNGAKVCSLAPGVIDTDMQRHLRGAEDAAFPDRASFENLSTQGQLASPDEAAERVLAWLRHPDFGREPVGDVRDYRPPA